MGIKCLLLKIFADFFFPGKVEPKCYNITIRIARMQQLDSADINIKHCFAKFDVLTHQVLQIFIPRETMPSTKSPEPGRQKKGRFSTGVRIFLISLRERNISGLHLHSALE